MKDFTYYDDDKRSLLMSDSQWLRDMGLKETRWILDREWFIVNYENRITFHEWINQ